MCKNKLKIYDNFKRGSTMRCSGLTYVLPSASQLIELITMGGIGGGCHPAA